MVVKKRLHIASDLPSLKKEATKSLNKSYNDLNIATLQRALPSLLRKANSEFETGDEESAFMLYLRYAELGQKLEKRATMGNSEKTSLINDVKEAIGRCELLSISLEERYEQARVEVELSNCPAPPNTILDEPLVNGQSFDAQNESHIPPMIPAPSQAAETNAIVQHGNVELSKTLNGEISTLSMVSTDIQVQKGPYFISCGELRDLIEKRQVMILDIRSAEAFADSHIKTTSDIVNIPKVYGGITAHSIAKSLSQAERDLFNRRKQFQKIVVVDWEGQDPNEIYSKPYCVSEALKKWVPSEEALTCLHLKSGYKLWLTAFPHDTTNPKPDVRLYQAEASEASNKQTNQVSSVRELSWLPLSFERAASVVSSSDVAPIVTSRVTPPRTLPSTIENETDLAPSAEVLQVPAKDPKSQPVPPTSPKDTRDSSSSAQPSDCSEITKIDKTSQDTIKQFTKAVNEKISVQKPRTFSEAEGSTPETRHPKATMMRSRSMGDIYEESSHRDSFNRSPDNLEIKRPSFDRSLKPTQSLEAATVHQPVDSPQVINNNNNNNNNNDIDNNRINQFVGKHPGVAVALTPRIEKVKPPIPPKSRRSQSPVQAYLYGTIDRTAGLRNLRNTCYLNSVVQALAHSTEFAHYFVRKEHLAHIEDPKRGSLSTLFARLLAQLWSQTDTREVLTLFRDQIGARCPMYRSSDQQDSHEFLMSLLTVLHEDLNVAPKSNSKTPCDDPDLVVTFEMLPTQLHEFYIGHRERQSSIVTSNFEGVLLSGLKCLTCEKDSYTFQVFTVLSVPVPSSWPQLDLQACFDQFFKEETVEEWHCPHCKKKRSATKQMKIARLPKHLIIHLIRFKNEPWISSLASIKKVNNKVHFTEDLDTRDFAQYVYSKNVQLKSYTLYGIVKHHGTLSNGHYIAECRFLGKQAQPWYSYNDQEVTPLRNTIDVDNAYMLFYSCVKNT